MAKAKIKGLDEAIDEIFKDYKKAAKKAAQEAIKEAKDDLHANAISCLVAYYEDYPNPESYNRTYSLIDSFVPYEKEVQEVDDGLICAAGVIFDASRVSYWKSWSYSDFDYDEANDEYIRKPADSEWIISNFLAGIHPRTDGSKEPGSHYMPYYGSFVPAEEMQRYINSYYYTFNRNFRRAMSKQILRKVRR